MRIFLILALLSHLLSCQQKMEKQHVVSTHKNSFSIKYTLKPSSMNVNLLYLDSFFDKMTLNFDSSANETGYISLNTSNPLFILDYSINQNYYIVYPNEEVIFAKPNNSLISLAIENETRKNELLFFEKLLDNNLEDKKIIAANKSSQTKLSDVKFQILLNAARNKRNRDPKKAIQFLQNELTKNLSFLYDYKVKFKVSKNFGSLVEKFLKAKFEAEYYQILLDAENKGISLKAQISDSLSNITSDLKKDTSFYIPSVIDRLKNYLAYNFKKYQLNSLDEKFEFIDRTFFKDAAFFAKFLVIKQMPLQKNSSEQKLIAHFSSQVPRYGAYIQINLSEKATGKAKTELVDINGKKTTLDSVLSKHFGKKILLDFWATWCIPCINEFPHSRKLEQKLGNDKYAFIYLSIDEKYNIWKESSKTHLLDNNYWIPNQSNSSLIKKLKLQTIPRYVLIDSLGKIVNDDAPRPSSKELRLLLLEK